MEPSTNANTYITIGDLNFIFSQELKKYYTNPYEGKTKSYFTCAHTGDIRLIYKTLMDAKSHLMYFSDIIQSDDKFIPPNSYYKMQKLFIKEIELVTSLGLMSKLYRYSRNIKYKFQCDDGYKLVNADEHFTRRLPFFCVPTLPAKCNLKQITAMLLSTYHQASIGRTSVHVLHQTYTLLYPVIKDLCNTYIFKEYCINISINRF